MINKKKLSIKIVVLTFIFIIGTSCSMFEAPKNYKTSAKENFDALWHIMDERYCFFDLKFKDKEGWDEIYEKYRPKIRDNMSEDELFSVLNSMLKELKDGHVNIITAFDYGHNWSWQYYYNKTGEKRDPLNSNIQNIKKYLGDNYRIAGGISYKILDYDEILKKDSIGYMRIPSFSSSINNSNIDGALIRLKDCKGLIIDIRDNGGGSISISDALVSHLYDKDAKDYTDNGRLVGYIRHKTGKGHNEFSSAREIYLKAVSKGVIWLRPTIVLTNGGVFSAANDFVMKVKGLPYIAILGDDTGGGSGLPMSSELPNGWGIRYSSSRITNRYNEDVEFGIEPNIKVKMNINDILLGRDTYIEEAVKTIDKVYKNSSKKKVIK